MKKTAFLVLVVSICCIGKLKAEEKSQEAWINVIHPCSGEIMKFAAGTSMDFILDKIDEWAEECEGGVISPEV